MGGYRTGVGLHVEWRLEVRDAAPLEAACATGPTRVALVAVTATAAEREFAPARSIFKRVAWIAEHQRHDL
jgi:hypothetical protein